MFRRSICIALIVMFVLTGVLCFTAAGTPSHPQAPLASPLFDMSFDNDNDTFELFTEQGITIKILVQNPGFAPIFVTVVTDSDYCTSDLSQDTGSIMGGGEVPVIFQFNWGRELDRDEEIRINFTGAITGDVTGTNEENLVAYVKSAAKLSGKIVSFDNDGNGKQGGEDVTFRTQVLNDGNIPATFMVKLFNGKNEVENRTSTIDVGGTENFDILWVAEEGSHNFHVKLYVVIGYVNNNPNGVSILEHQGDSSPTSVDIDAGSILTEGVDNKLAVGIALVVILVIVVAAFLNRDKIKKFIDKKRKK